MNADDLPKALADHQGFFHCTQIREKSRHKDVLFRHRFTPPFEAGPLPDSVCAFYGQVGSLTLYEDPDSQEAAYFIAPPPEWEALKEGFEGWTEALTEEEELELLPSWIQGCAVVGEVPRSGNYLLVPLSGEEAGAVYLFDHDGFDFTRQAGSLCEFVAKLLDVDHEKLLAMASHLRFCGEGGEQWWIEAMSDNRGNWVRTAL